MNRHFYILCAILAVFFLPHRASGQTTYGEQEFGLGISPAPFERVGMSGWQFLKIPTSARIAAMGGVATAISHGDASFAFNNPASTTDVEDLDVFVGRINWIADIGYNVGSVVKNLDQWGYVGINATALDYGTMYRTENIEVLDAAGRRTGNVSINLDEGTFSGGNLSIGLTYGRKVTDRLQIGGNLRYMEEQLDDVQGAKTANWALDIGTVYYTGIKSLRIAMVGRNFGPDTQFSEYDERIQTPPVNVRMPMSFSLGAAIDLFEDEEDPHFMTLVGEFVHPNDGREKLNFGAEYTYNNMGILRAGYRYNYDEEGLTIGAGVRHNTGQLGLRVDYALVDFGRLNYVHLVTLGISYK